MIFRRREAVVRVEPPAPQADPVTDAEHAAERARDDRDRQRSLVEASKNTVAQLREEQERPGADVGALARHIEAEEVRGRVLQKVLPTLELRVEEEEATARRAREAAARQRAEREADAAVEDAEAAIRVLAVTAPTIVDARDRYHRATRKLLELREYGVGRQTSLLDSHWSALVALRESMK